MGTLQRIPSQIAWWTVFCAKLYREFIQCFTYLEQQRSILAAVATLMDGDCLEQETTHASSALSTLTSCNLTMQQSMDAHLAHQSLFKLVMQAIAKAGSQNIYRMGNRGAPACPNSN